MALDSEHFMQDGVAVVRMRVDGNCLEKKGEKPPTYTTRFVSKGRTHRLTVRTDEELGGSQL